jgi:uncharacterized protein (TIGR02145 family)
MKFIQLALFLLLSVSILTIYSCKKEKNVEEPPVETTDSIYDPPLPQEVLQVLEDASVNYNDFLDSLKDINGQTYRSIYDEPNWQNRFDSLKAALKTESISISDQIKQDLDNMLVFGGGFINENTQQNKVRPIGTTDEPEQMAYAYVQRTYPQLRQVSTRQKPNVGNTLHKSASVIGVDCSGFLYFLLKSQGYQNCNFSTAAGAGSFQTLIPASVNQKFTGNAELINLGNLTTDKIKRGDFMVFPGHVAIIDRAGINPIAYQSNGSAFPPNVANHKTNYEYSGPIVKRGISAKDYNWLKTYISATIDIYRIVPIIDKGEIVSGNNQSGAENQNLSQPLKVKVLDKTGSGIPGVKVVFTVSSGGGAIVGNSEVETNDEGIAQVTWKLGTQVAGNQKVLAKVKKFNGADLEGTPIEFSATIGGGCGTTTSMTDASGNEYPVVQIGNQCWTKENLRTTKYADGSVIPNITDDATWQGLSSGAWCNYYNISYYDTTYGKLYNWFTVADTRNVCPVGWHVPTDAEWTTLTNFLGGESVAGGKMKTTAGWEAPNTAATNESGFSGLPGASRDCGSGQLFSDTGYSGFWWSSSESSITNDVWYRYLYYGGCEVISRNNIKIIGMSIRCLKD